MTHPIFTNDQLRVIILISAAVSLVFVLVIGKAIETRCKDWIEQVTGKRPK